MSVWARIADGGAGYSCTAGQRMVVRVRTGQAVTPFLRAGDRVRVWIEDADGRDLFGKILQEVKTL